jgi:complement component 1 Q subcomponent-binding protein, mitochondrial
MVCQEGHFIVENVSYYKDAKLGTDLTAEADWKRRGLYIGPQVCMHLCSVLEVC